MRAIFAQVVLGQVSRGDQQLDIGDAEMRRRPPEHPRWRVLLVPVNRPVEVDLVQVTADREPVQRNVLLPTLAPQIIAEVHRPTYLQKAHPRRITRATSPHYRYRPRCPQGRDG